MNIRRTRLRTSFLLTPQGWRHVRRSGTTLTEVLIAILIMAIGIVSVAAMFPLALLRTVQASQLTSATILRFNAESMIEVDTEKKLVFDPNRDGNLREHYRTSYVVDPIGFYTAIADVTPNDDLTTVPPKLFGYDNTNTVTSKTQRFGGVALGTRWDADGDKKVTAQEAVAAANFLVTLPDSWITEVEDVAKVGSLATDRKSLTLAKADLSRVLQGNVTWRAHIFDSAGRQSQVRVLNSDSFNAVTRTISWAEPLPMRLAKVPGDELGPVRIEVQDRRYTWLLTVRYPSKDQASVDVVVFCNRSYDSREEQIHLNNGADVFVKNSDVATVQYPTATPPWLSKGSWCFDPITAHWYRIQRINTVPNGTMTIATLQLSQPAFSDSSGVKSSGVMFFRGVVDVYPIGILRPTGTPAQ